MLFALKKEMTYGNSHRDPRSILWSFLVTTIIFGLGGAYYAYGQQAVTLTVTVAQTLTFTTSTDQFGTLTPGTYKIATTTLSVTTNNTAGWNVTLSGDDVTTPGGNTACDLDTDASIGITDQAQWVPGSATTTAGNAVVRTSLDSSGNVLAFRVMSASSSNGVPFLSTSWWGTSDADGTAKWAGVASSTVARQIGNAGAGSYSASAHLSTVQYYLNVAASQAQGAYSCPLTFTATGN